MSTTADLTSVIIDLFKKARSEDKASSMFFNAAIARTLEAHNLEKIIIQDVLKNKTSFVKPVQFLDKSSRVWGNSGPVKGKNNEFWFISEKGNFVEFPTIFSEDDKKKLDWLRSKECTEDDKESLEEELAERADVQNYCRLFEDRVLEIIVGFSLKSNRTILVKKEKFEGNVEEFLKNSYPSMKKDVMKYNVYRETIMFLETIFLKEKISEYFLNKKEEESKKEKESLLKKKNASDKKDKSSAPKKAKNRDLEKDFLETYWEVVRDKYFWNKVKITDSKKAIENFSLYKMNNTSLGEFNPNNKMNNLVRSLFIFVLKQIRRKADNRLFNLATEISKFYKPVGFFKKFEDEIDEGRIFAENPKVVAKNYLLAGEKHLKKDNIEKYIKKLSATKTLYNRMDMRSTFVGQQLKTDFNHCFANKEIISLVEKRRKLSLKLKKDKDLIKILPKKYNKSIIHKFGCKIILKKMDLYNPINEFLAEKKLDFLLMQEEVSDCINLSNFSCDNEGVKNLVARCSNLMLEKKFPEKERLAFEKNAESSLVNIIREFVKDKDPSFKK